MLVYILCHSDIHLHSDLISLVPGVLASARVKKNQEVMFYIHGGDCKAFVCTEGSLYNAAVFCKQKSL